MVPIAIGTASSCGGVRRKRYSGQQVPIAIGKATNLIWLTVKNLLKIEKSDEQIITFFRN